ncbi:ATP-binding protein [Allohahella sp. A8]|mgnify:CR=1 FL=1|uniref:sensor histidine kinase n=1 Tax=Allohahella sp. A8 TaxID=3141461 RepID=UPI0026A94E00
MRFSRILSSSSFRLAFVYMLLFAASVFVLLGFIYWATVGFMTDQVEETIQAEIQGLAEQYRRQGLRGMVSVLNERVLSRPTGESLYLIVNSEKKPLAGNLNEWPAVLEDRNGWISFYLNRPADRFEQPHLARAKLFQLQGGYMLLVGRDVYDLFRVRALIEQSLLYGIGITIALAFLGGVLLARGTRSRIETINQTSRKIMQGDLSLRVPVRGTGDDFDELAVHLNRMLEQIEELMAGVKHVSDNIAHDLRTPLTRLRSRLEVLSSNHLDVDSQQIVEEALGETDRLLITFNSLLRIARIESGGYQAHFTKVDMVALVNDAIELYDALAQDKHQTVEVELASDVCVSGDQNLLFQAVANLLDNAIKYSPENSRVGIELSGGREVRLTVWDTGPGIAPEEREHVFERFYRVDKTRGLPGNGLGLSMVRAVARMHKGRIELSETSEASGGLRVIITLPTCEGETVTPPALPYQGDSTPRSLHGRLDR